MVLWILLVLLLLFVQTLLPPTIQYVGRSEGRAQRMKIALGPRDEPPPPPRHAERATRALKNMFEALPIFLSLAFLCLILEVDASTAILGAAIFFLARVLYVPCYVFGVSGVRSAMWGIGVIGLLLMLSAVLQS